LKGTFILEGSSIPFVPRFSPGSKWWISLVREYGEICNLALHAKLPPRPHTAARFREEISVKEGENNGVKLDMQKGARAK
jgi:hypothetical protein